jgi:plastocyanin
MKSTVRRLFPLISAIFIIFALVSLSACSSGYGTTSSTTSSPPASGNSITLANFAFSPAMLPVKAGTTVTWTNKDSSAHSVTSDGGVFDSGSLAPNATFTFTFNSTGTFAYHCSIHPSMKGTVVVQ